MQLFRVLYTEESTFFSHNERKRNPENKIAVTAKRKDCVGRKCATSFYLFILSFTHPLRSVFWSSCNAIRMKVSVSVQTCPGNESSLWQSELVLLVYIWSCPIL